MNKYILPFMGSMKLKDVRLAHCQELLNTMADKSKSLQRQVKVCLNSLFEYACRNGLLAGNPAQYAEYSTGKEKKRDALTPEQVSELLKICQGNRAELLVHVALFCGLRRGELSALQWGDIIQETQMLRINKAVEFIGNQPREKATKTVSGERVVPIPPHLWAMLSAGSKKSLFVLPSARGQQLTKSAVRKMLEPVFRKLSFPMTLHQLRHTYSTILHKLGVDPKTHQYLMGHAELSTSYNVYTHIQQEQLSLVSDRLTDILNFSQKSVKESV
jgi:integrase